VPEGVNGGGKGKAPAVEVEPPTPVDGPVRENGNAKKASVEDAEGEDEDA
jgi:hypothetical protein